MPEWYAASFRLSLPCSLWANEMIQEAFSAQQEIPLAVFFILCTHIHFVAKLPSRCGTAYFIIKIIAVTRSHSHWYNYACMYIRVCGLCLTSCSAAVLKFCQRFCYASKTYKLCKHMCTLYVQNGKCFKFLNH